MNLEAQLAQKKRFTRRRSVPRLLVPEVELLGQLYQMPTTTLALLVFILPVSAQFQFFEQMFNQGGHQQQQQPQNAGSDSAWYQQRYEDGKI
jgi:hypothetical protein